jgi:hypothetical protein
MFDSSTMFYAILVIDRFGSETTFYLEPDFCLMKYLE